MNIHYKGFTIRREKNRIGQRINQSENGKNENIIMENKNMSMAILSNLNFNITISFILNIRSLQHSIFSPNTCIIHDYQEEKKSLFFN
jgi:hypothetical protein